MSNPYFTFDTPITPGTRARAGEVNELFAAVETGFDNIPAVGAAPFGAPTVKVGLTFAQGSANFVLRTDAQLALDMTITPTWTGVHAFSAGATFNGVASSDFVRLSQSNVFTTDFPAFRLSSANPGFELYETDAVANGKLWRLIAQGGTLSLHARTDADVFASTPLIITRTGTTISSIALAATAITLNGVDSSDFARVSQNNTFTGNNTISNTAPSIYWLETDAAVDAKMWRWIANGATMSLLTRTDADGTGATPITVSRSGTVVTAIDLVATAITLNGNTAVHAANLMPTLLANDGSGSGLDADLLDGVNGASYLQTANLLAGMLAVDGAASGLDADLLDGVELAALPQLASANVFTNATQSIQASAPSFRWRDTAASSGAQSYAITATGGSMFFQLWNDAYSSGTSWMSVQRSANVASFINLTSTNLLWNGAPLATSGTYTPVLSNALNIAVSVSDVCSYMRVGNTVTVSGSLLVTNSSGVGVDSLLGISLPFASAVSSVSEGGGAGKHNSSPVGLRANVANDRMDATWFSSTGSAALLDFSFTYRIV